MQSDPQERQRPDFPNEAEASLLSYASQGMAELAEVRMAGLAAEAFFVPARRIIFAEMVRQAHEQGAFDLVSVADALARDGRLESVGGYAGLTDAMIYKLSIEDTLKPELRKQRVQLVLDAARRRDAAVRVQQALCRLKRGENAAAIDIMTAVDAVNRPRRATFHAFNSVAKDVVNELEQEFKQHTHITGIRSGYHLLDNLTAGFQPGNVYVVAARPSMGKTALGLNFVQNMTFRPYNPAKVPHVAIVSAEMSQKGLFRRVLASESQLDLRALAVNLTPRDQGRLLSAVRKLKAADSISVLEAHRMDIDRICTDLRLLHAQKPVDLIMVDYLQLIPGTSERAMLSAVDAVAEVSGKLHALALSMQVPVIALAQLNRDATGKTPSLRDIKGSGSIEQDADVVILIDRPEKRLDAGAGQDERDMWRGVTILDVAKNRNGETGRVLLDFDGATQRFEQRADQSPPCMQRRSSKSNTFRFKTIGQ